MSDDLAARWAAQLLAARRAVTAALHAASAAREACWAAVNAGSAAGGDEGDREALLVAYEDLGRVMPDVNRVRVLIRAPYTLADLDKEQ